MSISTKLPKLKILVSGAGIAGNCLAYWLARTGLNSSITVMERSPQPRATGQAIDIRGPAIEVIKKMNLEEAVRAYHTTEVGTRAFGQSGQKVAEFTLDTGNTFTAEYEILRADLCGLFLETTEKLKNVRHVYGDYVKSLEQSEAAVETTFASGAKETFDVVIGADGATSKIRSMILDETTLKDCYKPIGQYIAFFSIPREDTDTKFWDWYTTPKGLAMMTRPHRNNTTMGAYLVKTTSGRGVREPAIDEALEQGVDAQKRVLRETFQDAGWQAKRILDGMDRSDDFYMTRAAFVTLPKWHAGRSVLIGDAAFATFGIGTTLAIHSAYMLAGELGKIQSSADIPAALERYEEVFRPIREEKGNLPKGFPQIAFPQSAWGLGLRNALLLFVSKTRAYKLLPGDSKEKGTLQEYRWVDV